VTGRDYNL